MYFTQYNSHNNWSVNFLYIALKSLRKDHRILRIISYFETTVRNIGNKVVKNKMLYYTNNSDWH